MVLDQGYWPESTLTPPTDEAIQYDIRMTKEMGFNGARKHQKVEDPRFLYWADKMGLLVSSEMANAYLFDEDYVQRFTREWTEAVERDYNHPSIIMWVPINESWGVPNLRDPRQQHHLRAHVHADAIARRDAAGDRQRRLGAHRHDRPVRDPRLRAHRRTAAREVQGSRQAGRARAATMPASALAPGFKYNGTPVVLSEFGGIAYIMPGQQAPEGSWGYSGVENRTRSGVRNGCAVYG